jgi:hypothetical protein
MKRMTYLWITGLMSVMAVCSWSFGQASLADAARAQRKDKQSEPAPKRVYDNDNLPAQEHISVVGTRGPAEPASLSESNKPPANADSASSDNDKTTKLKVESDPAGDDHDKINQEWQKKIKDQKDTVKLLEREADVLQREYRLRAAAMYADIGNRLRNSSQWDKEDKDYKNKIDAKQKELALAKQQLSDMQEQARKAGVPPGMRE